MLSWARIAFLEICSIPAAFSRSPPDTGGIPDLLLDRGELFCAWPGKNFGWDELYRLGFREQIGQFRRQRSHLRLESGAREGHSRFSGYSQRAQLADTDLGTIDRNGIDSLFSEPEDIHSLRSR